MFLLADIFSGRFLQVSGKLEGEHKRGIQRGKKISESATRKRKDNWLDWIYQWPHKERHDRKRPPARYWKRVNHSLLLLPSLSTPPLPQYYKINLFLRSHFVGITSLFWPLTMLWCGTWEAKWLVYLPPISKSGGSNSEGSPVAQY